MSLMINPKQNHDIDQVQILIICLGDIAEITLIVQAGLDL